VAASVSVTVLDTLSTTAVAVEVTDDGGGDDGRVDAGAEAAGAGPESPAPMVAPAWARASAIGRCGAAGAMASAPGLVGAAAVVSPAVPDVVAPRPEMTWPSVCPAGVPADVGAGAALTGPSVIPARARAGSVFSPAGGAGGPPSPSPAAIE
jgi:hypothetical protein